MAVAIACFWIIQGSEPDGIHDRNGTRAHGKDVAQNSAHPSCRSLERFDEAWVIVRFDLKRDGHTVADIDDSRILAGALQHVPAFGRQLL